MIISTRGRREPCDCERAEECRTLPMWQGLHQMIRPILIKLPLQICCKINKYKTENEKPPVTRRLFILGSLFIGTV
ncbi:MAG: hypothetical protein HFE65_01995 [Clostridiales bacterium]|nr:hypothetical protein [Clostridiales bacterium]